MKFHAHLGNVQYHVEGSARRNNALKVLDVAILHLDSQIIFKPHKRIMLLEEYVFNEPLTPVLVLTKIFTLLIQAKRFLEIMAGVIRPPMVHKASGLIRPEASAKPSSYYWIVTLKPNLVIIRGQGKDLTWKNHVRVFDLVHIGFIDRGEIKAASICFSRYAP